MEIIDNQAKNDALRMALSMYIGEPCRICGLDITEKDIHNLVFAGYSFDNKSRSAHGDCWEKNIPQSNWAYP